MTGKVPDSPLGKVVEEKLAVRKAHAGHGKSELKAVRKFIEALVIEVEQVKPQKWLAQAKEYPRIVAYGTTEIRAIEKLNHIMTVAKRNELGTNIRVQIDGEMLTPTLTK